MVCECEVYICICTHGMDAKSVLVCQCVCRLHTSLCRRQWFSVLKSSVAIITQTEETVSQGALPIPTTSLLFTLIFLLGGHCLLYYFCFISFFFLPLYFLLFLVFLSSFTRSFVRIHSFVANIIFTRQKKNRSFYEHENKYSGKPVAYSLKSHSFVEESGQKVFCAMIYCFLVGYVG